MKRALSLFCLILIVVYGVLSFLGSESPYIAESRFWKARALAQKIVQSPETTPPALFEKSRQQFEQLMNAYPQNKTLVKESLLGIAGLFIHEKRYQEARDFIYASRKKYPDDKPFGARTQFLLGFSYEKVGDWEDALKEYLLLRDRYPQSQLGLEMPLYIARHDAKQDSEKGAESYKEAAEYYRRLAQTSSDPIKYFALSYLLRGYDERKKWDKSLEVVQEIVVAYPKLMRVYIPKIERVARKLKQPKLAIAVYETFVQSHPQHKDVPFLKKRIELLSRRLQRAS